MLLHRRPRPADPAVEARVGRLLLPPSWPAGGWVPPEAVEVPRDDDALVEVPRDDDALDDLIEEGAFDDDRAEGPPDDVVLPDRSLGDRLLGNLLGADRPPAAERSWAAEPEPAAPSSPSRGGLLPATLAGGRLDPGHRGAVALLLVCVLAAVVAAGVVLRGRPAEVEVPAVEQAGTALPGAPSPSPSPPVETELVVAVVGEVVSPGVVTLPVGSRVHDAVRAAGGLAPGGSSGLLNLARRLVDGEQVVVGPDVAADPAVGGAAGASGGGAAGGLVDLNAATPADLDGLPGIGPVLAERIIEWRTENGPFASIDQLREVPGIGEAKYSSLKSKVAV